MRCVVGNNIDHLKLEILLVEQQILMLRVHIHQLVSKLLQHRKCHWRIVDESTALAGSSQFAADDTITCIVLNIVFVEKRLHVVA